MPFDPYFSKGSTAEKPIVVEVKEPPSLNIVALPDPIPEAAQPPPPVKPKPEPKKKSVKHFTEFQPFHGDTIAKAQCDVARLVALYAPAGHWQLDALKHLIELYSKEQGIGFEITLQSLRKLIQNSIRYGLRYEDGWVKRIRKPIKEAIRKGKIAMIMLGLDQLIRDRRVKRVGSNAFMNVD